MNKKRADAVDKRLWSKLGNLRFIVQLTVMFSLANLLLLWLVSSLQSELVKSTALKNAAAYAQAITVFRLLYTSEVVVAAKAAGMRVSHDYQDHPNTIPLPATLSMRLGELIGAQASGADARLYSAYPFSWRDQERIFFPFPDAFARDAWQQLNRSPELPFYRFEQYQGKAVLRFATADILQPGCLDCHNNHPDSPKTDWQTGDVRGVLEVILPIDKAVAHANENLKGIFLLLSVIALLGGAGIVAVVHKLRSNAQALQQLVNERTKELAASRDEARKADRVKGVFLANMSHEIRTPMNAVLGYAQVMDHASNTELSDKQRQNVKNILSSGNHLMTLINSVLDISKIEAKAMAVSHNSFDLGELLVGIGVMFRQRCDSKGLSWHIDNGFGNRYGVSGDQGKLRQVLANLLGNAVKFTDQGSVTLSVNAGDDGLVAFVIEDTGPGIPESEQQHIFDPFYQGDSGTAKGGTGLGLAITKEQIALMGGALLLDSQLDQGTRFFFSLPLPHTKTDESERSKRNKSVVHLAAGYRVKALVVDDVAHNRDILAKLLQQIGIEVMQADNGQTALALLQDNPVDIVFMDIWMPVMDGIAALKQLQIDFAAAPIPCVAVTATNLSHDTAYYLDLGFADFIAKPFNFNVVYHSLQHLLAVEFEYESQDKRLGVETPPKPVALPDGLVQQLNEAIELYRLSDIRDCIALIDELGEDEARLAQWLEQFVSNNNIAEMAEELKKYLR